MIKLGQFNSRMKDFYDIWLLFRQFSFELSSFGEAVKLTFKQRGTELSEPIGVHLWIKTGGLKNDTFQQA